MGPGGAVLGGKTGAKNFNEFVPLTNITGTLNEFQLQS